MSFAGGAGRKSPFTERAKATKSHLSPRRSTSSSTSGVGSARSAQQSLFGKVSTFGGKDSQFGDSSAKVSQLRNGAQPDVNEPTTPTRSSEGSNSKGIRRDEFSSFNSRRVGTPVKTPRTVFGSIPPPSPKRPYMGSPKYQKVLLERPAFYNSPAAGEASTVSGKKEVSISELQKRLKRFLQDENVPCQSQFRIAPSNNLEEVPYNISRSPRVNPLYHHEDTVLQVAKGGVAFTVGESDTNCTHGSVLSEEEDVSAALQRTPSPEVEQLLPRSLSEDAPDSNNILNETSESSEAKQSLSPEDFPVYSEGEGGSQVEEVGDELRDEVVVLEANSLKDLPVQLEQQCTATNMSGIVKVQEWPIEDAIPLPVSSAVEILEEEAQEEVNVEVNNSIIGAAQEEVNVGIEENIVGAAQEEVNVEVEKNIVGAAQEHQLEAAADCTSEEVEEEIEILESWSKRFLRFVVLAVMVACMMGLMALSSGSQGLLPKSLRTKPVAGPLGSSIFTPSVIPIAVGFMGLGKEHERMPCLPSVHLGLKLLSSTSKSDSSQHESSSPSYASGSYEPISVAGKDSELVGIHNVMDLDQLKTATHYYKELQGRLLFDVASLTSDGALSDSFEAAITRDGQQSVVDNVLEIAEIGEVAVVASEDVSEVVAIEEVKLFEDVTETASMEDISELVGEIAEELQLKTLSPLDDFGREVSVETLAAENLENLQINLDAISDPETDKLAAEMELVAFNLVTEVPNEGPHAVRMSEFVSSEATNILFSDSVASVTDSQLEEVNPSVIEEFSIKELASKDFFSISDEVVGLLTVQPVTEEITIQEYPIASVQGTDEDSSSGSSDNVDDLVDYYEEELVDVHHDKPLLQSTTEAVNLNEQPFSEDTCKMEIPVSNVVDHEEPVAEGSMGTIGLLVVALALAVLFLLKFRKSPTVSQADEVATEVDLFPGRTAALTTMDSPPGWPTTQSVYDSHVPDRDELDAITSPLKSNRAPRKYGIESYSTRFGSAEPAMSAPGVFKSPARVVQKPATTWHPAMKAGGSTISSSYRQTASYVPRIPSESGISFSTRDTIDSVCESALTMGAEEWEHLGSYTTSELISAVTEGGEERKVRTPVRRSQRIRNRVSPLPAKFDECYL